MSDRGFWRDAIRSAKATFGRRKGVVGFAVGRRDCNEESAGEISLIILVEKKLALSELRGRKLLPRRHVFEHRGRNREVPIDVQETNGEALGTLNHSGTPVSGGGNQGTVGGVVRRGNQVFVLTSGHVAVSRGRRMVFGENQAVKGRVSLVRLNRFLDHALVVPDTEPQEGVCSLVGLRTGGMSDRLVGRTLRIYSERMDDEANVGVRQVFASCRFRYGNTTRLMNDLIATDRVTERGDSGALLYDPERRLAIGHVLGSLGDNSYFLPFDHASQQLGVSF